MKRLQVEVLLESSVSIIIVIVQRITDCRNVEGVESKYKFTQCPINVIKIDIRNQS